MRILSVLFLLVFSVTAQARDEDLSKPLFAVDPARFCAKGQDGEFIGPFQVAWGESASPEFVWGEGGGCILRPLRDAWGVLHNQPLMKWDGVDAIAHQILTPVPGATHLNRIKYTVNDIITVKWTMDWHHAIAAGTAAQPLEIVVNYRRISGTQYIPYWEGTVILRELEPGVVAFAMRNQILATNTDAKDAGTTVQDVFGKVTTGEPDLEPITPKP